MAAAQPVWSRVDEAQHADYIAHLAQGQWPLEGRTRITATTLAVMERTGIYRWQPAGTEPAPPERSTAAFTSPPTGVSGRARTTWTARHLWTYSYEAAQPPLFYLLAVPAWLLGGAAGGPLGSVYAVRILDAVLVAMLAPLAMLASLLVAPSRTRGLAAAVVAGLLPGMVLNGTAITNDTLAAVLGGVLTVLALLAVRRGWTLRLAAVSGAVLGLALLAKLTAAALVAGLAVGFLWPWMARRAPLAACLKPAVLAFTVAAAVVAPWLLLNLVLYRHLVPTAEADQLLGSVFGSVHLTPGTIAASFKNGYATFWSGEPWDTLPINRPLTALGLAWCLVAAVGIQRMLRAPGSRAATAVVTAISLGTAGWAFTAMLLSHVGGLMPGRYTYPALVATAVVLVQGGAAAFGSGRWRALAAAGLALYVGIAGTDLLGYAAGWTAAPRHPVLAPPGRAPAQSVRLATSVGPVQLTADQVVRDPADRRLFVHLAVSNGATTTMEWWPVAVIARPGEPPWPSDYPEGTALPQDLAPGGRADGWVVFDDVPAADLAGGFQFGFLGVATDGYRDFGDLLGSVPAP